MDMDEIPLCVGKMEISRSIPITDAVTEMASTFVARELRSQVVSLYIQCMNGETHIVPKNPVFIFSGKELDEVSNARQRIFYSYFSSPEAKLRVKIDFEPDSEFDYLLVGMSHMKIGIDGQLTHLLERRPELFIFTLPNFFAALFTPHIPHGDFQMITITPEHDDYPLSVMLDDEIYDCLEAADLLHGSPLLRDVTFHMSANHHAFKHEIARRRKVINFDECHNGRETRGSEGEMIQREAHGELLVEESRE
jgi:hypothetical protein